MTWAATMGYAARAAKLTELVADAQARRPINKGAELGTSGSCIAIMVK
ncbi:MAG: hypothetical protein JSR25_02930 [Proteobacteria bacterium]|nr:hypothetical protein [Pseudomonadota bacterium]